MIVQHDTRSAQEVNSPKILSSAHQTKESIDSANKNKNNARFDHLNLRKNFVEIDSIQYPTDSFLINYEENDYIEQYKNLKLFFKEYTGEPLLNLFISFPAMETKCPIAIIDLGRQPDHKVPKKFNYFKNITLILIMLECS